MRTARSGSRPGGGGLHQAPSGAGTPRSRHPLPENQAPSLWTDTHL